MGCAQHIHERRLGRRHQVDERSRSHSSRVRTEAKHDGHAPVSSSELVSVLAAEDESRGKTFDPIRFFCEDGRLMFAHGRSYAFSCQWTGPDAKRGIEALVAAFPD